MAQTINSETSAPKRVYRKGNPLTVAERKQVSLARKKATHKELRVFIPAELKDELQSFCEAEGVTQADMVERLIKKAISSKC